ncbi:MAG: ATP-binding cassette domain-containing protein, partial [Chloroflexota bacterium]|nr:ATP-binding cassette domain-containing protein [Chloroflexota bacterium]
MEQVAYGPSYDIEMEHVSKTFGDHTVVSDASLHVEHGEIFGFIGPSGSGKTTTIRLMTGVYTPTSGRVRVLGQEPAHFSRKGRERIGYLPQQFVMYPNLSVLENIRFVTS